MKTNSICVLRFKRYRNDLNPENGSNHPQGYMVSQSNDYMTKVRLQITVFLRDALRYPHEIECVTFKTNKER